MLGVVKKGGGSLRTDAHSLDRSRLAGDHYTTLNPITLTIPSCFLATEPGIQTHNVLSGPNARENSARFQMPESFGLKFPTPKVLRTFREILIIFLPMF